MGSIYIYMGILWKMDETPDFGSPLGRHDFQGDKCIVTGSPAFFHGSSGQQLGFNGVRTGNPGQ